MMAAYHDLPDDLRLNIGGKAANEGWRVLDIQPGDHVDFVGHCGDLGRFPDACCRHIYASHVIEHLSYQGEIQHTFRQFRRILKPDGLLQISVPDIEFLCRMFIDPRLGAMQRFQIMGMMFGGQRDQFDFHRVGLNHELLAQLLTEAGFRDIERVDEFRVFRDNSSTRFMGELISLNVQARK